MDRLEIPSMSEVRKTPRKNPSPRKICRVDKKQPLNDCATVFATETSCSNSEINNSIVTLLDSSEFIDTESHAANKSKKRKNQDGQSSVCKRSKTNVDSEASIESLPKNSDPKPKAVRNRQKKNSTESVQNNSDLKPVKNRRKKNSAETVPQSTNLTSNVDNADIPSGSRVISKEKKGGTKQTEKKITENKPKKSKSKSRTVAVTNLDVADVSSNTAAISKCSKVSTVFDADSEPEDVSVSVKPELAELIQRNEEDSLGLNKRNMKQENDDPLDLSLSSSLGNSGAQENAMVKVEVLGTVKYLHDSSEDPIVDDDQLPMKSETSVTETPNGPTPEQLESLAQMRILSDQLNALNQETSHLSTHIHQKPKGKRHGLTGTLKRSPTTPRKSPYIASSCKSQSSAECRTPKSTPRRSTLESSFVKGKSILKTPCGAREPANSNSRKRTPIKFPTPSKSRTKRKLYTESPDKVLTSAKSKICANIFEDLPSTSRTEPSASEPNLNILPLSNDSDDENPLNRSDYSYPEDIDENELRIAEQLDIDEELDEKSRKLKVTVMNVRSIIHQLITNEHVKDMVRNTLEEGTLKAQLKEAIFEPKMTRSKLKEAIEKGQIPPTWTLTPVKDFKSTSEETFLNMSFPEEEDDDEYQPTIEELDPFSDDDESIQSSQASDFGSPSVTGSRSVTPSARAVSRSVSESENTPVQQKDGNNTPTTTPMGPPTKQPPRVQNLLDQKVMNIALRTRSKLPLTDTSIDAIESSFTAPDFTPDMYATYCDDADWMKFLTGLTKDDVPSVRELLDDETNDPEYNFIAENEQEEEDEEERRCDKGVEITKKEIKELMDELFDACCQGDDLFSPDEVDATLTDQPGVDSAKAKEVNNPNKDQQSDDQTNSETNDDDTAQNFVYPGHMPPLKMNDTVGSSLVAELVKLKEEPACQPPPVPDYAKDIPVLTIEEQIQIRDQMRKHVQLLAQTYVQSVPISYPDLEHAANTSKHLLSELRLLGDRSFLPYEQSFFRTPNLEAAVELTHRSYERQNEELASILTNKMVDMVLSQRTYDMLGLTYEQMDVFANSPVFMFPQMLPEFRFLPEEEIERRVRIFFSESEDNLLAMGLDQFGHLPSKYRFIRQFLLPTKTEHQLLFRTKNLKANRYNKEKPAVKYLIENKRLPEFERYLTLENEESIVAPKYRDRQELPKWFPAYEHATLTYENNQKYKPWSLPKPVPPKPETSPYSGRRTVSKLLDKRRSKPAANVVSSSSQSQQPTLSQPQIYCITIVAPNNGLPSSNPGGVIQISVTNPPLQPVVENPYAVIVENPPSNCIDEAIAACAENPSLPKVGSFPAFDGTSDVQFNPVAASFPATDNSAPTVPSAVTITSSVDSDSGCFSQNFMHPVEMRPLQGMPNSTHSQFSSIQASSLQCPGTPVHSGVLAITHSTPAHVGPQNQGDFAKPSPLHFPITGNCPGVSKSPYFRENGSEMSVIQSEPGFHVESDSESFVSQVMAAASVAVQPVSSQSVSNSGMLIPLSTNTLAGGTNHIWGSNASTDASSTTIVASTVKGASVVVVPVPNYSEPAVVLTVEQLKQLGITLSMVSMPTVSTARVAHRSDASPGGVSSGQGKDRAENPNTNSSPDSNLLSQAFAMAMGIPEDVIQDMSRGQFNHLTGSPLKRNTNRTQQGFPEGGILLEAPAPSTTCSTSQELPVWKFPTYAGLSVAQSSMPATQTLEVQPPGIPAEPYSSDNQTKDGQPAWFDLQSSEPLCQPVSVEESSKSMTSPNYIGNELLVTTCSSFPPVAQSPSCEPSAVDAQPPLQPSLVTSHAPIEQTPSNMSPSHATPSILFPSQPTSPVQLSSPSLPSDSMFESGQTSPDNQSMPTQESMPVSQVTSRSPSMFSSRPTSPFSSLPSSQLLPPRQPTSQNQPGSPCPSIPTSQPTFPNQSTRPPTPPDHRIFSDQQTPQLSTEDQSSSHIIESYSVSQPPYVIDASSDFPQTDVITSTEPVSVDASSDIHRDNVAADVQTTFRTPEMFPDPSGVGLEDSLLKNKSSDSLSPMGLDMLANHSDLSPHSGMQHRKPDEVSSILCTPQKLVFEDACHTPSKQPLLPRVIATTESPFKRGIHALAQLALMITPPKSPRKETSQTPPSRCSTKSLRTRPSIRTRSPLKMFLPSPRRKKRKISPLHLISVDGASDKVAQKRPLKRIAPKSFLLPSSAFACIRAKAKRSIGRPRKVASTKKTRRLLPILPKIDASQTVQSEGYTTTSEGAEGGLGTSTQGDNLVEEGRNVESFPSVDLENPAEEEMDDEEIHIAELLAASTTIDFDRKVGHCSTDQQRTTKAQQKKELMLALLVPDLVASDKMREDRDALFVNIYRTSVELRLKENLDLYRQFLQLLSDFGRSEKTVTQLYQDLKTLLVNYPDLVDGFAGFLLPEQAVECGCFLATMEFERARTFMCKLEKYFHKHPMHLQKCVRAFKAYNDGIIDERRLSAFILSLIRNNAHLVDEFSLFFCDERPPASRLNDFEEATMGSGDEENMTSLESYEKVNFPSDSDGSSGTLNCRCHCHAAGSDLFVKKIKHCTTCGLKIIKGQLYLQTSDKLPRPATVVYLNPNYSEPEIIGDIVSVASDNLASASEHENVGDVLTVDSETLACTSELESTGDVLPTCSENLTSSVVSCPDIETDQSSHDSTITLDEPPPSLQSESLVSIHEEQSERSPIVDSPPEATSSLKLSMEGIREESSDEQITDAASVNVSADLGDSDVEKVLTWTRDDDKQILEMCKELGPSESTYQTIATKMTHRNAEQIGERFAHLMKLYAEIDTDDASDTDEESDDSATESPSTEGPSDLSKS